MFRFFAGFLIFASLALPGRSVPAGNTAIRLDPSVTYQTISGWETTVSLFSLEPEMFRNDPQLAALRDREVIVRLVEEIGINRVRLSVRSGAENSHHTVTRYLNGEISYKQWRAARYAVENDNADPMTINPAGFDFAELDLRIEHGILPMRERLAARGETLFVNLNYVAFTKQITDGVYLHDDPEEYAEFVLATYLHMQRKYGFVPDAWEVILEPDNVSQWRRDPRLIGRAIVAAARRLKEHGFTPSFIAPSVANMENAVPYFDALASVPGALIHLRELSYHRYGGRTEKNLRAIASRAQEAGVDTSMLEWWFGRATYEVLHEDLKTGNNVAWQGRAMAGHFVRDEALPAGIPLKMQEDVRYTRQYTRSIRHGAVRIAAASSDPRFFDPVAFVNPDGSWTVVVKAARQGTLYVMGLPAGSYRISYAVQAGSIQRDKPVMIPGGGKLTARIPGRGVLTVTSWAGIEDAQ